MTIKTTRWTPDTCSDPPCVIEYTWDTDQPSETRTHNLETVVNKCSRHSILSNTDVYTNVKEENTRKNQSLQTLVDNMIELANTNPDGSKVLKDGITFNWSWSGTPPNTVLTISFDGVTLSPSKKNTAQTYLNNKFGAGKVIIV